MKGDLLYREGFKPVPPASVEAAPLLSSPSPMTGDFRQGGAAVLASKYVPLKVMYFMPGGGRLRYSTDAAA